MDREDLRTSPIMSPGEMSPRNGSGDELLDEDIPKQDSTSSLGEIMNLKPEEVIGKLTL